MSEKKIDYLAVSCPRCAAGVGKPCRPKRVRERKAKSHVCRARKWLAIGLSVSPKDAKQP